MTARLIASFYVCRHVSDTDTRANILQLTEKGRAFLSEIFYAWTEIDAFLIETLGDDGAKQNSQSAL
jgi:DNA-binding MarR family transcriptional regulator